MMTRLSSRPHEIEAQSANKAASVVTCVLQFGLQVSVDLASDCLFDGYI